MILCMSLEGDWESLNQLEHYSPKPESKKHKGEANLEALVLRISIMRGIPCDDYVDWRFHTSLR